MSEEKLVTIAPVNGAIVPSTPTNSSWGDEDEEVKTEYVKIRQNKTKNADQYELGNFFDNTNERQWKSMDIVVLGMWLTRKFQSAYTTGDSKPEVYCRSRNRVTPVTHDNRFTPKAANCKECAFGQKAWANYDAKTKTGKPANPCNQEVEMLYITKSNPSQPYLYVFNGSGGAREIGEAIRKKLISFSKEIMEDPAGDGRRPEIYEFIVSLSTIQGQGKTNGEFWYPHLDSVVEASPEELDSFGDAYTLFVKARNDAFQTAKQAAATEDATNDTAQPVAETPAAPVSRPVVVPPASRRSAGARPAYKPPVIIEGEVVKPAAVNNDPKVTI